MLTGFSIKKKDNRRQQTKNTESCLKESTLELALSYLETPKGSLANSADPDQTPHNVASGQGLQCLLK